MRPFITLSLFGALLAAVANADEPPDVAALTYPSYAFGKEYTTVIREDVIEKSPMWLDTAENPPVSVRKARRLADAKRQQLVHDTARYKWRCESVALEFYDQVESPEVDHRDARPLYWHVHYEAHGIHGETGIPNALDLFVLMDGSLVEPTVTACPGYGVGVPEYVHGTRGKLEKKR